MASFTCSTRESLHSDEIFNFDVYGAIARVRWCGWVAGVLRRSLLNSYYAEIHVLKRRL